MSRMGSSVADSAKRRTSRGDRNSVTVASRAGGASARVLETRSQIAYSPFWAKRNSTSTVRAPAASWDSARAAPIFQPMNETAGP